MIFENVITLKDGSKNVSTAPCIHMELTCRDIAISSRHGTIHSSCLYLFVQ